MTEDELIVLRQTHNFEMVPREPKWLHPEAKAIFDKLEGAARELLRKAHEAGAQSEAAYLREVRMARESVEVIRQQQRHLVERFLTFDAPMILAKPKTDAITCAT